MAAGALLLALTACSGEGGGLPTELPTELPSGFPTTLPSITLPTLPSPTITLPTLPSPTITLPTITQDPEETSEAPDPETTAPEVEETTAPEVEETTAPEVEETTAPEEETTAGEETTETDEDGLGWLWLLLLALAAAVIAGVALIRRRRARAAWEAALAERVQEATWLRDSLIPDLLAQGADGRSGIWAIARTRVLTLEQHLTDAGSTAPEEAVGQQVGGLSSTVQAFRRVVDNAATLPDFGGPATTAALQQSQAELDERIRALQPPDSSAGRGATRA